ncbi:MAG: glycosyltransferase family 4 protein [candidate division SR1 bacterium]|nr:glycosyltransferase family 4 protein [candidate division SR1 bacterium]
MKVLQFLPYFPPHIGGVEAFAKERSSAFSEQKKGKLINVVFSPGQPENLTSYEQDGYTVMILPAFELISNFPVPKIRSPIFWSQMQKIKAEKADIIQTNTRFFLSTFLGGLLAKLRKIKRIHIEHGSGFVKGLSWRKTAFARCYDQIFGRLIFRLADSLVAISQANLPFIQQFTRKKISVIYRGFNFTPVLREKKEKPDQILIGFVGRLVKLKGVDLLIEAFAQLEQEYRNLRLQIIGDGEERCNLEKQVEALGLGDKISFLGYQSPEKVYSDFLPHIDIFVNPSLQEGLPTTVIEALFAQCITVATGVGGTREIADGEDFIVVEPGSVEALKGALNQALALVGKANGASYQQVRERFGWKRGVGEYLENYRILASK